MNLLRQIKKRPDEHYYELMDTLNYREQPDYVEIRSILSDQVEIRFSVPCHEWNELVVSKEWKAFQALLEKCQIKQPQKRRLTAKYQQEVYRREVERC